MRNLLLIGIALILSACASQPLTQTPAEAEVNQKSLTAHHFLNKLKATIDAGKAIPTEWVSSEYLTAAYQSQAIRFDRPLNSKEVRFLSESIKSTFKNDLDFSTLDTKLSCNVYEINRVDEAYIASFECELFKEFFTMFYFRIKKINENFNIVDIKSNESVNWYKDDIVVSTERLMKARLNKSNKVYFSFFKKSKAQVFDKSIYQKMSYLDQHSSKVLVTALSIVDENDQTTIDMLTRRLKDSCQKGITCLTSLLHQAEISQNGEEVISLLERMRAEEPKSFLIRKRLADWYLLTGAPEKALAQAKVLLRLEPEDSYAYSYIFSSSAVMKKTVLAEKSARVLLHSFKIKIDNMSNVYTQDLLDDPEFRKRIL